MKKFLGYTAGLIALYVVVANGANFKTAAGGAGDAATKFVKTLQGRG